MEKGNQSEEFYTLKPNRKVPYVDKLKKYLLIIELILISVAVLGFYVSIELLTVSLIILAIVYYFLCYTDYKANVKINKKLASFMMYLSNWGKSVIAIGILFSLTDWAGNSLMMSVGIISVLLVSIIMVIALLKGIKDEIISSVELIRNIVLLLIAIFIYIEYFGTTLFV